MAKSTTAAAKTVASPKFVVMVKSNQANYGPQYLAMANDEDEAKRLAAHQSAKLYPLGLIIYKAHVEVRPTTPPVEYVTFAD